MTDRHEPDATMALGSLASRRALLLALGIAGQGGSTPCVADEGRTPSTPVRIHATVGTARLEGRVTSSGGRAAAQATVSVYGWSDLLVSNGSYEFGWTVPLPTPRATATTNTAGEFAVEGLPQGMHVVRATASDGRLAFGLATATEGRPVPVLLTWTGHDEVVHGEAVEADGAPVAGANVIAVDDYFPCPLAVLLLAAGSPRTVTDRAGRFTIRPVDGEVLVAVERPTDGRWATARWVEGSGTATSRLRIPFVGTVSVTGRVEGSTSGRPIAGARVIVVAGGEAEGRPFAVQPLLSGPAGRIRVERLPPVGGFAVLAPGIGGDWIPYSAETDARLRVRRGARLSGRIRTADGRPVAGARVVVHVFSWPAFMATSGEDGAYAFEGLPRTRPWQPDPAHEANGLVFAWVEAPGYASSEGTVPLRVPVEAASLTQDFTLHPGVTIRGRATDAKPMDGVAWISGEFGPYAEMLVVQGTLTGKDGAFGLVDLPPGKVPLRLTQGRQVVLEGLRPGETREDVVIPAAK